MRYLPQLIVAFLLLSGAAAHAAPPIQGTPIEVQDVENLIEGIANFLLTIGGIIAVGYMVYGGIKMATSGGNDTGFGEGKKILTNAIIGAVVIFGVGVIINTIANFGEKPTSIFP